MERPPLDIDTSRTVHGGHGQVSSGMNPAMTGNPRRLIDAVAPKSRGAALPRRWGWILQPRRWRVPRRPIWTLQRFEGTATTVAVHIERGR